MCWTGTGGSGVAERMKDRREKHRFLSSAGTRLRRSAFAALLLTVLAAVLVGLNLLIGRLETEHGWQRDLSFNGVTSYGAVTEKVLRDLDRPVKAYVVYDEDRQLLALLDRYAAATPYFTWETVDVALNPGFLTRYRTELPETSAATDSIVFECEETGRFRVVSYSRFLSYTFDEAGELSFSGVNYESAVTYAIQYVTRETSPRAVFLHGHGEMDESETEPLAYLLSRHFYDVVYASLGSEKLTLEPRDVVLILSPTLDLSNRELGQLSEFAEAGGSFVFAVDWTTPTEHMPNLCTLMRQYGIVPRTGLVVADAGAVNTYYEGSLYFLLPMLYRTEASAAMADSGASAVLLPGASAFETPEMADQYVYTDVLLGTGADAYLIPPDRTDLDRRDGDPSGPFVLALLGRRITQRGVYSSAFAVGCSVALTDAEVYARTDHQELIMRVMGWLAGESEYLGIEGREAVRPQLSVRSLRLGTTVVFMLPAAVIVAAAVVLGIRRKH